MKDHAASQALIRVHSRSILSALVWFQFADDVTPSSLVYLQLVHAPQISYLFDKLGMREISSICLVVSVCSPLRIIRSYQGEMV